MSRRLVILFALLEALFGIALGIGIVLVPFVIVWGVNGAFQATPLEVWRIAVDAWALGHAVPLDVTLPAEAAAAFGEKGEMSFVLSLAPLGFALFTLVMGYRAGRRVSEAPNPAPTAGLIAAFFAVFAFLALASAQHDGVTMDLGDGTVRVVMPFVVGMLLSWRPWQSEAFVSRWVSVVPRDLRELGALALRVSSTVLLGLVVVSSTMLVLLLVAGFATEISLYEAVHGEIFGGVVLTFCQLLAVPTVVVWAASWIVGPGFSLGVGTIVSPDMLTLGTLPSVPLLGLIPLENSAGTLFTGVVPVLAAIAAARFAPALVAARGYFDVSGVRDYLRVVGLSALAGVFSFAIAFAVGGGASGSAGPGRFFDVGIDVFDFAFTLALGTAGGALVGAAARLIRPLPSQPASANLSAQRKR